MRPEKITVEIGLEELGRISIALDRIVGERGNVDVGCAPGEWARLKQKWDDLYRSTHKILGLGVKGIHSI